MIFILKIAMLDFAAMGGIVSHTNLDFWSLHDADVALFQSSVCVWAWTWCGPQKCHHLAEVCRDGNEVSYMQWLNHFTSPSVCKDTVTLLYTVYHDTKSRIHVHDLGLRYCKVFLKYSEMGIRKVIVNAAVTLSSYDTIHIMIQDPGYFTWAIDMRVVDENEENHNLCGLVLRHLSASLWENHAKSKFCCTWHIRIWGSDIQNIIANGHISPLW